MMRLTGSVATHVGNVRESNQDRAHFGGYVAVVADGMGGHQGGEMAATIAVNEFLDVVDPIAPGGLVELVEDANRAVFERAADPDLRGMGTTLVALTLRPTEEKISIVNVGDSRAYFVRGDQLGQLTLDHSLVEDLVRQNRLTPDEALNHPQRNILTRALGIASEVEVDRFLIPTKLGDRFLLCSDGLFNEVSEDEILRILSEHRDPEQAADALVSAALAGAGRDNITVAVVDVVDADSYAAKSASATAPNTLQMPIVEPDTEPSDGSGPTSATSAGPSAAGAASSRAPMASGGVVLADADVVLADLEPVMPAAVDTQDVPLMGRPTRRFAPVLLSLGIVALVVAAGYYLAGVWAERTWFVATAEGSGALAVYNGKPGGFLWVDADRGDEIGVELDQLSPEARLAISSGETFGSKDEALDFVTENTVSLSPPTDEAAETEAGANGDTNDESRGGRTEAEPSTDTASADEADSGT